MMPVSSIVGIQLLFFQSAILCCEIYELIKINWYYCIGRNHDISGFRICCDKFFDEFKRALFLFLFIGLTLNYPYDRISTALENNFLNRPAEIREVSKKPIVIWDKQIILCRLFWRVLILFSDDTSNYIKKM